MNFAEGKQRQNWPSLHQMHGKVNTIHTSPEPNCRYISNLAEPRSVLTGLLTFSIKSCSFALHTQLPFAINNLSSVLHCKPVFFLSPHWLPKTFQRVRSSAIFLKIVSSARFFTFNSILINIKVKYERFSPKYLKACFFTPLLFFIFLRKLFLNINSAF